jgi:hypothetical protein
MGVPVMVRGLMNLFDIRHYKISRAACLCTDRITAEKQ